MNTLLLFFYSLIFFSFSLQGAQEDLLNPIATGHGFRSLAQHTYDEHNRKIAYHAMKDGDIVFVKTDMLSSFFQNIHSKIPKKYILITHNSDDPAALTFRHHLEEEKIIAWLGQNPTFEHPKFHIIPLGIANIEWAHGNPSSFAKMQAKKNQIPKQYFVYLNFSETHPDRKILYDFFSKKAFCSVARKWLSLEEYLLDVLKSEYVLSPRGNGLDTHRTFEALLMGTIPIVQHSPLDPFFVDMRVLLIDNWFDITEEFLRKQLPLLKMKSNNDQKLYLNYYIDLIKSIKVAAGL